MDVPWIKANRLCILKLLQYWAKLFNKSMFTLSYDDLVKGYTPSFTIGGCCFLSDTEGVSIGRLGVLIGT